MQFKWFTSHKICSFIRQKIAEETKKKVEIEEKAAKKKAQETQAIADDAQHDLDEALPALV